MLLVAPDVPVMLEKTPVCVVEVSALDRATTAVDELGAPPTPIYPFTVTVSVEASPSVTFPVADNVVNDPVVQKTGHQNVHAEIGPSIPRMSCGE